MTHNNTTEAQSRGKPTGKTRNRSAAMTRNPCNIKPRQIIDDPAFSFREGEQLNKGFVRSLTQALRSSGQLEPITVWAERDAAGHPTGRLVLIDGRHRLAAYRTRAGASHASTGVPAVVISGLRRGAVLEALRCNSREKLALTQEERLNAAWRLVRDADAAFTVPETAEAAAVAPRTVDNMRKRWRVMQAAGTEPSGAWWRDQKDGDHEAKPEMTDEELEFAIAAMAAAIGKAAGPWRRYDLHIRAKALQQAMGGPDLRSMAEYLYGEEEDDILAIPVSIETGTTPSATDSDF